jgi:hypothetical protein
LRARAAAVAAVAAALTVAPAAGAAVSVDVGGKRCYAEGDQIEVNGAGYTPNGDARLTLERANGEVLESTEEPRAADDGTVRGAYQVDDETGWFSPTQSRFEMVLRLVDLTRLREGRPATDPEVGATASFIFSRWSIGVRTRGGRIHPRRPVRLSPVGYTNAIGRALYAHWMRNGRRVHTRRLGILRGPCGDLTRRLSRGFPFRPVRPGSYTVRFSTSRTSTTRSAIIVRAVRVRRTIR